MKKIAFVLGVCSVLALPGIGLAQNKDDPKPTQTVSDRAGVAPIQNIADPIVDQSALIKQAGAYLNGLTTAKARFLLTAADGTQQIGTFYLKRPGKLRFEYDPPAKDFIVADGVLIYFYDAQLKQQSNAPIGQTLADFLLRKDIKLDGNIKVDRVMRGGGLLQITVRQASDPGSGTLTLGFTENPMALKKWRVVDAQNQTVEVELFQLQTGLSLEPSLFVFHDPSPKKKYND